MMKNIFLSLAFALVCVGFAPSASAQQPSPRAIEAALADMSAWMGEYYSVSQSTQLDVEGYIDVLHRLVEGKLDQNEAIAAMQAWRDRGLERNADAQRRASLLRPPPDMSAVGEGSERLDAIIRATSESLRPMLDNQRQMIERLGELGLHAIREPRTQAGARMRAVIESQLQVIAGAKRRITLSRVALTTDHPNHAVFGAALAYYEAIEVIANDQPAALDNGGNPALVASNLRASAASMRRETARGRVLAERLMEAARWQQAPENATLANVIVRMAQTFPELLGYYNQLADALERAATKIETGQTVVSAWSDLDTEAEPPLQNIARMDRERAAMMGQQRPPL